MSIFEGKPAIIIDRRLGTQTSPYVQMDESLVINPEGKVILSEIPDTMNRLVVEGDNKTWYEIQSGVPTLNQYKVDYINKVVTLNISNIGKQLNFKYMGTGNHYYSANSIYTQENNGDVTETLKQLTDSTTVARDTANTTNDTVQLQEDIREQNEDIRITNENVRVGSEVARDSSETTRLSAETTRNANETNRVNMETARVSAETGRVNAESLRVSNENIRQTQETARQTNTTDAINNANIATTNANNATTNANIATTYANEQGNYAKEIRDNFGHKGEYSNIATYENGNVVSYGGVNYFCIQDTTVGIDPLNGTYWTVVSPQATVNEQSWIATEGQTVFTITGGSYVTGQGLIEVFAGGVPQISGQGYTETNSTTITLSEGVPAGTIVFAKWYEGAISITKGHKTTHEIGGSDELDITKMKNYTEQVSDKFTNVDAQLAEIATNVKNFGAKGDGVTDDLQAIRSAITATGDSGRLYFPPGDYVISDTLTISKPILIEGQNFQSTRIINNGINDAIVLNTTYRITMQNIKIQGNINSKSGVVIGSSYYNLDNVHSENNGEHGFKILGNTWNVNFNKCKAFGNEKDGLNAVAVSGTGQINAVNISQCLFHSNKENGLNLSGVSFNITGNTIEQNEKSGIFIQTKTATIRSFNIKGNYFEANNLGNISLDLYPSLGFNVYGLDIDDNFLAQEKDTNNPNLAMISVKTDTTQKGISSMKIGKSNLFYTESSCIHVDLGNSVGSRDTQRTHVNVEVGLVGDNIDHSIFYKNLGTATLNHYANALTIQGYFFAKGVAYSNRQLSDNLTLSGDNVAYYPIMLKQGNQIRKASIYVETNSTNYTVKFNIMKNNNAGTYQENLLSQTVTGNSNNKTVLSYDAESLTAVEPLKLTGNNSYFLMLTITNLDGAATSLKLGNPTVYYYD